MGPCTRCGTDLAPEHRFCPSCGEPTGDDRARDAAGYGSGVATGVVEHRVERRRGGPRVWVIALGVIMTGLAATAILRSGDGSNEADAAAPTTWIAAADVTTSAPTTTTPTTTAPPTTTEPEPDVGPATTEPLLTVDPELPPATGLTLITGDPMVLLNLEDGTTESTTIAAAFPVAVIDDRLVYVQAGDRLGSVPVDDPDALPSTFETGGFVVNVRAGTAAGTIEATVQSFTASDVSSYTYDIVSGDVLDVEPFPLDSLTSFGLAANPAGFRTPRSGGVYQRTTSGWERRIDGALIASGAGLLLVEQCADDLTCTRRWFDDEFEEIERFIPDPIAVGEVLTGGRLLLYREDLFSAQVLLDLETGEKIADVLTAAGGLQSAVSTDPSGRFVTFVEANNVVILDVDTGVRHRVLSSRGVGEVAAPPLLIETPD